MVKDTVPKASGALSMKRQHKYDQGITKTKHTG